MGVSFAIPMDVAMDVVAQIKEQGYVSRGWLGVVIQDVTRELAESFGLDKPKGALVSRVLPDSPASKAGFEPGDVILSFNGREIPSSSDLPPIVGRTPIGKKVKVEVMRQDKLKTLRVEVEELPESEQEVQKQGKTSRLYDERLGVEVNDLTEKQREQLSINSGGVTVVKVDIGPAADAGLRSGDVVLSIDNVKVEDAKHFLDTAKDLPSDKAVPVLVQRGEGAIFLAIKIKEDK
jgi:serine protease Do